MFLADNGVQHVLTVWVTWRVSYKRQELLTLCEYLSSSPPQFLYEDRDAYLFIFSVVLLCVFPFLVPCCDVCYDFHIIRLNLHLFVCGLMSYYVFCVRVRIVMSNILLLLIFLVFCVVCLFRFHCPRAVSCVPNVARLSVLSTLDCVLCFFSRLFISVSLKLMGGGFSEQYIVWPSSIDGFMVSYYLLGIFKLRK